MWVFVLLISFFEGNSVALTERAEALYLNPAGLGFKGGVEFYLSNPLREWKFLKNSWRTSALLGNMGIGLRRSDGESFLRFGLGIPLGRLSLGFGYEGKEKELTLGFLLRPLRYISLGATYIHSRENTYRIGAGIRPFTERLTLFGDLVFRDSVEDFIYGIGAELLDGVILSAKGDREKNFTLGLDISLGFIRMGSKYTEETEDGEISLVFSKERYNTPLHGRKKYVEIELSGDYPEEREVYFFRRKSSFYDLLSKIESIKKDPSVKVILLKIKGHHLGFAQAEELRRALLELKERGKGIISFGENYSLRDLYIASVADKIILVPTGYLYIPGLFLKRIYFTGTMEKLGMKAEMARVGKYKSAVEPFTRKDMSEADREQYTEILRDIYEEVLTAISSSRGIGKDSLMKIIDEKGFLNSDDAFNLGLVDTLLFEDGLKDFVERSMGKLRGISLKKYGREKKVPRSWVERPKIALVIAEGSIIVGKSGRNPYPLIGGKFIGSETMVKIFERIEKDKSIKAVVLRVNSPGGSGLASEIIANALKILRDKKPVIVSMGNVAGSGGYYISTPGKKILADKMTLTGSIGVLGGKIVMREFYEKLGLSMDYIKFGRHADAFSSWRSFTEEERKRFKDEIEWFYRVFIERVAESRKISTDSVHRIAQGRVWSGIDAKDIGIVDEVGGLMDAINLAKEEAGIKEEVDVVLYPFPKLSIPGISTYIDLYPIKSLMEENFLYLMPEVIEIKDR
jgi:protease-4